MSIYCSNKLSDGRQLEFSSKYPLKSRFDEISLFLREEFNEVCIFEDVIQEAVTTLYTGLSNCVLNQITLNLELEVGRVGETWNNWTYSLSDVAEEDEEDIFQQYWIWSTRDFQTWVYQKDGRSYIEVSSSYRWHFVEPTENEKVIPFDEFMKKYNSVIVELSIKQINNILKSLEKIKCDCN
ncbi:hypothetical protein D3C76_964650 [compost metagenome]